MWASRNPDKVQQAGQLLTEMAGGPPGLTTAPNSRLRATEIDSLKRLAKQLGSRLVESPHVAEEVIVAGTKKTIDVMGHAEAYKHWNPADQAQFFASVKNHLRKSVTYIAIDLKGASKEQIAQITAYVNSLTKAERDRIIYIVPEFFNEESMAVISFSDRPEEIWCVAGWAFRQILDDITTQYSNDGEMTNEFEGAKRISGLAVELLEPSLAGRIKNAIRVVANSILAGSLGSGITRQPYGDAATVEQYRESLKELLGALEANELHSQQ